MGFGVQAIFCSSCNTKLGELYHDSDTAGDTVPTSSKDRHCIENEVLSFKPESEDEPSSLSESGHVYSGLAVVEKEEKRHQPPPSTPSTREPSKWEMHPSSLQSPHPHAHSHPRHKQERVKAVDGSGWGDWLKNSLMVVGAIGLLTGAYMLGKSRADKKTQQK